MSPDGERLPLVFLPRPEIVERGKLGGGGRALGRPSASRQRERLDPKFEVLNQAFDAGRAALQATVAGAEPESVVVLEIAGSIEGFVLAIQRIDGLELLGEFDEQDIPPDEDFRYEDSPEKPFGGTLFLVMTNQQALQQLMSLWNRYKEAPDEKFPHGFGRFRELFRLLRDVRLWGVSDRVGRTGVLEDWADRVSREEDRIPAEIELWFRSDSSRRQSAEDQVRAFVSQENGRVVGQTVIEEIRYHALLVELPAEAVNRTLEQIDAIALVRSEGIMFMRPTGQVISITPEGEPLQGSSDLQSTPGLNPPLVALLDGLPLEQHARLTGRLVVDDPDGWASDYQALERNHGTHMSSLIIWGDLSSDESPISTQLYVRPIMRPDVRDFRPTRLEAIPSNVLTVDLVHSAVMRMLDGGAEPAVAPTVKVINLSIADRYSPFTQMMSPWARLLDWLSWRFGVLFVVAAGNQDRDAIRIPLSRSDFSSLGIEDRQRETLRAVARDGASRRLLAPAECSNGLTVGAAHDDAAEIPGDDSRIDLIGSRALPSPISAVGLGYRRSIKPDFLMPGGRLLFSESPGSNGVETVLEGRPATSIAPGLRTASPSRRAGDLGGECFISGTSGAAALATRASLRVLETLASLEQQPGSPFEDDRLMTVTAKALLVHGSAWGESLAVLQNALGDMTDPRKLHEFMSRFLGFGIANHDRVVECSPQRITLVGAEQINADEGHVFEIPLPPSLSGSNTWRRLSITLGWMTPINPRNRKYRRAALWFDSPNALETNRIEADWHAARRGTVQHEVFEGQSAAAFVDGSSMTVRVNCRPDAGHLTDVVPYGLALTLEVSPDIDVPIYQEVRERVRPRIQVGARAG